MDTAQQQPQNENPLAETGNASNPSPRPDSMEPMNDNSFLAAGAEKYLREAGNIEDVPDAQEQEEADRTLRERE